MRKTISMGQRREHVSTIVADIEGVSPRYVRMVKNGDRNDDDVMDTLLGYQQRHKKLVNYLKTLRQIERSKYKKACR